MEDYWLTTKQIEDVTGFDRHYIYLLRDYGLLRMGKNGRSYGTTPEALREFLDWSLGKELNNEADIRREAQRKTRTGNTRQA